MLNYWWVTRPKRKLDTIPETLSCFASACSDKRWKGNKEAHLAFEDELEQRGLKRVGERKDQRGGGGRTYYAWLSSLGLVFIHEATGKSELTLAGEAIVNGENAEKVLRDQVLKYQIPSPFSLSPGSVKTRVHERFHVRPFRFILKLLQDERLGCRLNKEELARVAAVEACDETDVTYEHVIERVLQYREDGIASLPDNFFTQYAPSSGKVNIFHPYSHLDDLANTLINWLQYTKFIDQDDSGIFIKEECKEAVCKILMDGSELIDSPENAEQFQRKYGLIEGLLSDDRSFD